jgi:hypothetical protein
LPTFSGLLDFEGDEISPVIVVADCDGPDSLVSCTCFQCCATTDEERGCSDPVVANLDWTWEDQYEWDARNFGINMILMLAPTD